MIDFSEENRDNIKSHFLMFLETVRYEENNGLPAFRIADQYINNEISMQKVMQDYYDHLNEEHRKNERLLSAIKKVKGKTFFKYLLEIIEEGEGIKGLAEIVKNPGGKFQEGKYGRQIKGIWVDQWSVGMEGDSFEGIVCVQIKDNKYLKFSYSM